MRGPFVDVALAGLDRVAPSLRGMATGLEPFMTAAQVRRTRAAIERAVAAFEAYRRFLQQARAGLPSETAVGRNGYEFFLREVALLPYTPEQLLIMGRQEWARTVQFEAVEHIRNRRAAELRIEPD